MIGYCCCSSGDCTGSPGVSSYEGYPSVMFHPYLSENRYLSTKNPYFGGGGSFQTQFNVKSAPNFTYYMEGKTQKLSMQNGETKEVSVLASCHGSSGLVVRKVSDGYLGQNLMSSSSANNFDSSSVRVSSSNYGLGDGLSGNVVFKGYNNVSFWAGSTDGMRYGFDAFCGSYGCCFYNGINYIIEARGKRGVIIWQRQGSQTNFSYQYIGMINVGNTISTKVCVNGRFLYVGTCGYSKPKTSYGSTFDQLDKQPEFQPGNVADRVENINSNGVKIYNLGEYIDGIIEGKGSGGAALLNTISTGHVNDIKSGKGANVYVASSSGMLKIKRIERTDVNGNPSYSFNSSIYTSVSNVTAISILKNDEDEEVYYTVGTETSPCVYKNNSALIQGGSFSTRTLCTDPYVRCKEGGGWWGGGTPYDGYYAYRANTANENYFKRFALPTCSGLSGNVQRSPEQIGNFANGIVATRDALYVSFWGNGFAKFSKGGSLQKHYNDFMSTNCGGWKRFRLGSFEEFDINAQHTISAGPIACAGGMVFVSESVQYVASGSGPFIYHPFKTSTNVRAFTPLIKGYRPQKGLFVLK